MLRSTAIVLSILLAGAAARAVAGAVRLPGVAINSVLPSTGSIGTVLTIQGAGFASKPVMWLQDGAAPKKFPLKIISFTDSQVTAQVTGAIIGPLDVHLKIKKDEAVSAGGFGGVLPAIQSVSPAAPKPGATIVSVAGSGFGTAKGSVLVGGKAATVKAWTDTNVNILLPIVGIGTRDVVVKNKLGSSITPAVVLSPSFAIKPVGLNGVDFLAKNALSQFPDATVQADYDPISHIATVTCDLLDVGPTPARLLVFKIPFDINVDKAPKTLAVADGVTVSLRESAQGGPGTTWDQTGQGASAVAVVATELGTFAAGSVMAGTISGTLIRSSGTAVPASLPFQIAFRANL